MELLRPTERTSFTLSSVAAPLDLLPRGWQGRGSRPLEIDVGCHKGRFLVEMARRFPTSNFLGVERQRERVHRAQKKIALHSLNNAEVVHGDGLEILQRLPDACADCMHVLFPDPWPKRRHHTRRMVSERFLREVSRVIKVQGRVRLVTDDAGYARAMESDAAAIGALRRAEDDADDYPPTEFEIKFLGDPRPVYQFTFYRVS